MRLVDVDKIKLPHGYFEKVDNVPKFYNWLDTLPTVDAEPIRHGHWEHGEDVFGMYCQCSECGNQYYGSYEFKYCPNCGARMDAPTQKSVGKALKALEEEQ